MVVNRMLFEVISSSKSDHTVPADKYRPFMLLLHVISYIFNFGRLIFTKVTIENLSSFSVNTNFFSF